MDTQIRIKQDTLTKLKKFEFSVKIDGKHPKHSGVIELAIDTVSEVKKIVGNYDGSTDAIKKLDALFTKFYE